MTRWWTPLLLALLSPVWAAEEPVELFSNHNPEPVAGVPYQPTRFTLTGPARIVSLRTYHLADVAAEPPGQIALRGGGRFFGPWTADRAAEDANAWEVRPDAVLPAGTYSVLDSAPSTWARNLASDHAGMARVFGVPLAAGELAAAAVEPPAAAAPATPGDAGAQETAPGGADAAEAGPAVDPIAATDVVGEDPAAPVPDYPLPAGQQEPRAAELFALISATDDYDTDRIAALYREVMACCPDTDKAEESYWRLSNLYLYALDEPDFAAIADTLEAFLARYPASDGVPHAQQRLANAYRQLARWEDLVTLYGPVIEQLPDDEYGAAASFLEHAEALVGSGAADRARPWFERARDLSLNGGGGVDGLLARVAEGWLQSLDLRAAGDWQGLAAHHREQLGDSFPAREQLIERADFADALERAGATEEALAQYRIVVRIDEDRNSRQAALARERLIALGGEPAARTDP